MLVYYIPPEVHLLKAETAGTPETSVPIYETSGYQQTAVVNTDSNVIQRLHSTILPVLLHSVFQENFEDSDPTLQLPHTEHTSLGATYYDLSYFQRRISNQSVARDYGIVDAIFPTSACLVRETRRGEIYARHQSRHCRKCIRSPARSPEGHTADSEQDGISKKSRKR